MFKNPKIRFLNNSIIEEEKGVNHPVYAVWREDGEMRGKRKINRFVTCVITHPAICRQQQDDREIYYNDDNMCASSSWLGFLRE